MSLRTLELLKMFDLYPFSDVFLGHQRGCFPLSPTRTSSNYWVDKEGTWTLEIELPGVDAADLNVTADADRITLSFTRADRSTKETLHVGYPTKATKGRPECVRVTLKNGLAVIHVTEPKADKPAAITIPVLSE